MSGWFSFGGIWSDSYGVEIFNSDVDGMPASDYTEIIVPGKDGSLLIPNNRFSNVDHVYGGVIYGGDLDRRLTLLKSALKSKLGYQRLMDSFAGSAYYYEAVYKESMSIATDRNRTKAKFRLIFSRKPQKYLTSGEQYYEVASLPNPTAFTAKPRIDILAGTGETESTVTIGSVIVTITWGSLDEIIIDSQTMTISDKNGQNAASKVAFNSLDFPVLPGGETTNITASSGVSAVKIKPNWYIL